MILDWAATLDSTMKSLRLPVFCLLLLLVSSAAWAQPKRGLYVNVKYGQTDTEASVGDVFELAIDGEVDSEGYEVGWRINSYMAFQAGYHDLGNVVGLGLSCPDSQPCPGLPLVGLEADTKAYSLTLVPQIPLTKSVSAFGKVGIVSWDSDVVGRLDEATEFRENFSDEEIIYGGGLKLRLLGGLSIFYELEYLGDSIESQHAGASWQF